MTIQKISSGATSTHNEDLIAVYENDGFTDILIIDGGSSIADKDYIDSETGDVNWFTRNFAALLEKTISRNRSQAESVSLAIRDLHSKFRQETRDTSVPVYAYPIAAMTWVRITHQDNCASLNIYCLGDCKTFLLSPDKNVVDLDPYINPQESILQHEIARLLDEGVSDSAARRERLMSMLRARREFLNSMDSPTVLCLAPNGSFQAREHTARVEPGSMLIAMTDGFFRIVDTYNIYSVEGLANLCRNGHLEAVVKELRDFETASLASANLAVKRADDASAVTWLFGTL
jgi:hypothetical protein